MFEATHAAVEDSEKCWNSVSDFEKSVQKRFEIIIKEGRTTLNTNSKKGVAISCGIAAENAVGSFAGGEGEGLSVENDVASNRFIAMLEELTEHRNVPGYLHRVRKMDPNGMWDHSFFAARPVQCNEYIGDTKAMGAYWKGWKNLEEKFVWQWETLTEWSKVSVAARAKGEEFHLGFLFRIIVEKGSEFSKETSDAISSIV